MQLKKEIKSGDFKNAYLLYGEESYLKEYYANELKNKIVIKHLKHLITILLTVRIQNLMIF
jgi:DNA polymerase III delta subunit